MSFDASEYLRSEWLHGSDLPPGQPVQATIKSAYEFEFEQTRQKRPVIEFYELRERLVLNKTRTRAMVDMFGPNAGNWVGQLIELLAAPSNMGPDKPTILIRRGTPQGPPPMSFQGAPQPAQQQQATTNPEVIFGR